MKNIDNIGIKPNTVVMSAGGGKDHFVNIFHVGTKM